MNINDTLSLFNKALQSVEGYTSVARALRVADGYLHLGGDRRAELAQYPRVIVIGAGKAAAAMARAVEDILNDTITDGAVIVKYGHSGRLRKIRQFEAAHPIPDEAGYHATKRMLELCTTVDRSTLVLVLLSGGASALMVEPAAGIPLSAKKKVTDLLLRAGADISELNTVRKHLSAIKGGWLARRLQPARVIGLAISDVLDDHLDIIASGPLTPDPATFANATAILEKYRLMEVVPTEIKRHLQLGARGERAETPKSGDTCFEWVQTAVVANLDHALAAAKSEAQRRGFDATVVNNRTRGDANQVAREMAATARAIQANATPGSRICLLAGGETTVAVRGSGKGGRNQQMAMVFAREIQGVSGITFSSLGTDGTDGPTDVAGAMVDGGTWALANNLGLDAQGMLDDNDSYRFFSLLREKSGTECHVKTGPTGTNVADIQIVLIENMGP